MSGKTQAEALAKVAELKQQLVSGTLSDTKLTLGKYLTHWLEHKKLEVKPRTHEYYKKYAELYIRPHIGGTKLGKLTTQDVRRTLMTVKDQVSADAANKTRTVLSGALKQAVRDGLVPRNPVEATTPFKVDASLKDHTWEAPETLRFLETARTHRLFAAFYLTMTTGMRHAEVLGLRWGDIEGDTLHLRQSLINLNGGYAISTPKTPKGIRRVVVDAETLAVMETHRLLQAEEQRKAGESWGPKSAEYSDLIFTTENGRPIHPRNFDRVWYGLMERAQVRRIRFHDLRHMHVSLLNKAGMDARTIADRIGHTDPAFTIRRYAHVFEEQRRAAAIPLLELLTPR
ncbi:MAG: hypothetical protein AVDCRST_MAG93-8402, partial [uncultured Chloroflexia bacterium]